MAKRKMTATQKLRANVRRQISRMEGRGYRFSDEIKEKIKSAKYQTLKSYSTNRYRKLYGESTALTEEGEIVSGTKYQQFVRRESARKASETRRQRAAINDIDKAWDEYRWEQQRREQDALDYINANAYHEGEIVYDEINKLIDQYPTKGSESLKKSLANEIRKYGKNNVLTAIGMSPDYYIEHARQIAYYEEDASAIHGAFLDFHELITGTIPTDTEAKELGDTLDAMTDFESR